MPATHEAFEHFIRTGEMKDLIPAPRGEVIMPSDMTAYFTYEVGTDEPAHPDRDIAMRFVEVAMSDCKYGCKIYADPYSEVRVLVHSQVYGCKQTMAKLEEARTNGEIRPGDMVEFDPYDGDTGFGLTGKVLNRVLPDGEGMREKFRIGCYYLVDLQDVRAVEPGETYQQAYERLVDSGILDENQMAAYFGIDVETLQRMRLKKKPVDIYDGTEFKPGDMVWFKDLETGETNLGQIITYISPHFEPGDLLEETYGGYHIRTDLKHPVSQEPVTVIFYGKGSLTLAE